MDKTEGFYDFCIPYNSNKKVMREIFQELCNLGYKTVAIEQTCNYKTKQQKAVDIFPEPADVQYLKDEFKNLIQIFHRLTIVYSEVHVSNAMTNSNNVRKYNLIAGLPKTDTALTHCCTSFVGDIVTFDPESANLQINKKTFLVAIQRNMFFEMKYSPAIRDSTLRKDMIKLSHSYCIRGKSKNIFFSSSAEDAFELRGPYDVANLAIIFGLSEDQGKNAVNRTCRQLFQQAECRRIGKTVMFINHKGPILFSDSSEEEEAVDSDKEDKTESMEFVTEDVDSQDLPINIEKISDTITIKNKLNSIIDKFENVKEPLKKKKKLNNKK